MRYLENSYDKTRLKIDEATHLRRIYEDIKKKLEVVSCITFISFLNKVHGLKWLFELHNLLSYLLSFHLLCLNAEVLTFNSNVTETIQVYLRNTRY